MSQGEGPLAATKADAAYQAIRRQVLRGQLLPGAVLDQGALAKSLRISTTPVREALRRLEMEDLVVMSAHRDARVKPLSRRTLKELYEVRLELDPLAAALTAERASAADLQGVAGLVERHGQTPAQEAASNRRFHRAIYRACHNSVLISLLDSLWDRTDRFRLVLLGSPEQIAVATHEHHEIVAALQERDIRQARKLVRAHIEGSLAQIDQMGSFDE